MFSGVSNLNREETGNIDKIYCCSGTRQRYRSIKLMYRLLYVDDEPGLLDIGKIFLERSGQFIVDTVDSAPAALTLLNSKHFDAIISDFQMPDMNGIEFLKKVRTSGNAIPFILFTGRGREEVVIQALNEGADFYLQKGGEPLSQFAELGHKIRQAIQQRQADVLLFESEQRLSSILKATQVGIILVDVGSHRILQANPKALDLIGASEDEVIGNICHKFICPAERGKCPVTDLGQDVNASERVLLTKDGSKIPIIKTVVSTVIADEKILVESFMDLTERKRAESALMESEERFRSLFDSTLDMVQIIRPDRSFLHVNPAWKKTLGYTDDEVGKLSVFDIIHPDSLAHCSLKLSELISGAEALNIEAKFLTKDKETVSVIGNCIPELKNGTVVSIRGIFHDITERKRAEEALQSSEEHFRTIIRSLQLGVVVIDAHAHTILDANNKALEMIGSTRDVVVGSVCHTFICPAEVWRCPVTDLGQNVDSSERVLIKTNGEKIPVIKTVIRTMLNGKDVLIESFLDITERKHAEEALQLANKKLNLLTSITRHDINNQLTALQGYLGILKKDPLGPSHDWYFRELDTATERISSMIRFTKEYESIGVSAPVWQECRTLVDTAAQSAQLGKVKVKNDLPARTEVLADPLIVKVCYNLLDNAVRYGGKITSIRFSVEDRNGDHIVVCEDDGDGIPADEKEKIFQKGFGKNTGLGLFLAREILDITGITIRETGEPGKGARFEMMIPKESCRKA